MSFVTSIFSMQCSAKLLQSCHTLCHPMDCSPSGFSVHGILQARILESVAMPFSSESSWPSNRHCSGIKPVSLTTSIAGGLNSWPTGETHKKQSLSYFADSKTTSRWQKIRITYSLLPTSTQTPDHNSQINFIFLKTLFQHLFP